MFPNNIGSAERLLEKKFCHFYFRPGYVRETEFFHAHRSFVGVGPTGQSLYETLDSQRARPASATDMQQQQQQFCDWQLYVSDIYRQQCCVFERCIKNDLNLSGGLGVIVVTHSLIGLD